MFCQNCGKKIPDTAAFCPNCGEAALQGGQTVQQPVINVINTNTNVNSNTVGNTGVAYPKKSKWVAFFLCLFLGWAGIHRFYVGKAGTGVLYLFTGGLFFIGMFFDLLSILFGGFKDCHNQKLV